MRVFREKERGQGKGAKIYEKSMEAIDGNQYFNSNDDGISRLLEFNNRHGYRGV